MYAMYLRKSRADQEIERLEGEGETLARHKNILFKLAEKNGISENEIEIYQEIVSGDSIQARPEIQRLIKDLWADKFEAVLVVEIERLARGNTSDQGTIAEVFKATNTKIITPVKTYDPNNEFDEEYFEFGLFMSRREYKTIRRRLLQGIEESVREGNYLGRKKILGYELVKINGKPTLTINENEAEIIRLMYDLRTEEMMSFRNITRYLNDKTPYKHHNGNPFAESTVENILKNPTYCGKVRYKRSLEIKVYDDVAGKIVKKRKRNNENLIIADGKHEAIISEEQFNKAQNIRERPHANPMVVQNPFASMVYCANCGRSIRIHIYDGKYIYMQHKSFANGREKCFNSVQYKVFEEAVLNGLKNYLEDVQFKLDNPENTEAKTNQKLIEKLEKEKKKKEIALEKQLDAYEAGVYSLADLKKRQSATKEEIESIKAKINDLLPKTIVPNYEGIIFSIHKAIDVITNPSISGYDKNRLLKTFIKRIELLLPPNVPAKEAIPEIDIYFL